MNVTVIGSGYVGLTASVCFAEMGNNVTCVDVDASKIKRLQKGVLDTYEPGLKQLLQQNLAKNLRFSTSIQDSIQQASIVFIAVGTPMKENGEADLQYVHQVAREIGQHVQNDLIIVNKSTVPVGTADAVYSIIDEELRERNTDIKIHVVSNPEFLKEGSAINDFMKPDRIVIGTDSPKVFETIKQLYSPFFRTHDRFIQMDIRSAEMTKYAANAYLATKISFINEMANICEKVGADINQVRIGIGSDKRIGYDFLYPGVGFGGSCFPKDVKALQKTAEAHGYQPKILSSVTEVNEHQRDLFERKITDRFGDDLQGKTFAVWGLSFKPGTDDVREAPSLYLCKSLLEKGANLKAYDPKAMKNANYQII